MNKENIAVLYIIARLIVEIQEMSMDPNSRSSQHFVEKRVALAVVEIENVYKEN